MRRIAHIYHGATGNNGLYTDEIVQALNRGDYLQQVYVSYYYPFRYGNKYFYKHTDMASGKNYGKFRPYFRGIELIIGLIRTFISILLKKPQIINYSLIQFFKPELVFLRLLKRFINGTIILTCHDVKPFTNKYINHKQSLQLRKKAFETADYLLVHNENSKDELIQLFNIPEGKILLHPFPLMNLSKLYPNAQFTSILQSDFLYIGHMREEKGINLLLEAWQIFHFKYPEKKLILAGSNPNNYDFSKYKQYNVVVIPTFIDDYMYCSLIKSTKCIVLPYLRGTNSGVVSTVIGLGGIPICSDIPMFKNNPLIPKQLLFSLNSLSLSEKMAEIVENKICHNINSNINEYLVKFNQEVLKVYNNIQ